jgi:hypothetical protein
VPSYIITGFKFTTSHFQLGGWSFKPAIQALESHGLIFQDLQLPQIHWKFSLGESQSQNRDGRMVTMIPRNGTLRWYGSLAIFWIPEKATAPLSLTIGNNTTSIGSLAKVEYSVAQAQNIEIFKEFPGTNNSYISFKPSVPPGSLLGAIVQSVTGEAAYAVPLLQKVFDDSSFHSNAKEFFGKDQVHIEIASFCPKQASTAQLTFKRDSTELKIALANDLTPRNLCFESFRHFGCDSQSQRLKPSENRNPSCMIERGFHV